jgi:flavorubredoxin
MKTLIEAQQRYIDRVMHCHSGHRSRVRRSAAKELRAYANSHGYNAGNVVADAHDMVVLFDLCEGADD